MSETATFIPLSDYIPPGSPSADVVFGRVASWIETFVRQRTQAQVEDTKLIPLDEASLEKVMPFPGFGSVLDDMGDDLSDWLADEASISQTRLVILPDGTSEPLLRIWAREGGHVLLPEPGRRDGPIAMDAIPDVEGSEGVLVIPRLSHWFLRVDGGLDAVLALLTRIDLADRRVVVGCNPWAWSYLQFAVGAHNLLPDAVTFRPFCAKRLSGWLQRRMSEAGVTRLRTAHGGNDVIDFSTPPEEETDQEPSDALKTLASRSLGIPWVAWHILSRSLFLRQHADGSRPDGVQSLWVDFPDMPDLSRDTDSEALFILHALIVHGGLSSDALARVVPFGRDTAVLARLLRQGWIARVVREGGRPMAGDAGGKDGGTAFTIAPHHYPAARSALVSAGFPDDRISTDAG